MNKRTKSIYINSIIAIITQIIQVILGFVVRKIFISTLGASYLGYNSVFSNILQMLNLADLGIGVAITSYLYKPLADEDYDRVAALMYMYKKVYMYLGVIVFVIGIIVSFFLDVLIPDAQCGSFYLKILFYINLLGTVSTYYLAYNRTLLIADQKSYVTSAIDTISYFVCSIIQIIFLIVKPNYIIYLVISIGKNVISNIIITIRKNKEYNNISNNVNRYYIEEYKPKITLYVKDVFVSRIGAFVYYSTDNLIISAFKGSLLTGYLSNYTLITNQVNTLVSQMLSSIQATFGNYIAKNEDRIKCKEMINNYFCANFIVGNFCSICVICLIKPFIELVFGNTYTLSFSTGVLLAVNMMLTILLQLPSQVFQIFKLYNYDKVIVAAAAVLNIIISILLVKTLGINGCLIGTFITSLIYLFSRFYIISHKIYNENCFEQITKLLKYFVISILTTLIVYLANIGVPDSTYLDFFIKAFIIGIEALLINILFLCRTNEFTFLINKLIPKKIRRFLSDKIIIIMTILLLAVSLSVSYKNNFTSDTYLPEIGNKSVKRVDTYIDEKTSFNIKKNYHLSIDDVITIFEDINLNKDNYESIFQNDTLNWLREVNNQTGATITCYIFYENENFKLDQMTDKFKKEFIENSNWLRFGFHSRNGSTTYLENGGGLINDYKKVIKELIRVVGSESIDNVIRLQSFEGNRDDLLRIASLEEEPIIGLLTADDKRGSYYLNNEENSYIYCHDILSKDDLVFISTDLRIEFIDNIDDKFNELTSSSSWTNQLNILEVFTHEWELNYDNKQKVLMISKYAQENGYSSYFYEDYLIPFN